MPPRARGGNISAGPARSPPAAATRGKSAGPPSGSRGQPGKAGAGAARGLDEATDIQRLAFGPISEGSDVFGRSRTGTGKSLAFLLLALQRFTAYRDSQAPGDVSIVVLSPIKELSAQLASVASKLAASGLKGAGGRRFAVRTVIGKIGAGDFSRGAPCDLLVATPGVASANKGGGLAKLLMTDQAAAARLGRVRTLVLDEGDSLTDGGFLGAIKQIASHMRMPIDPPQGPDRLQLLVFSATLPPELANSPLLAPRKQNLKAADTVGHGHKSVGANVLQKVLVADSASHVAVCAAVAAEHIAAAERLGQSGGSADDAAFRRALEDKLRPLPARFGDFHLAPELAAALASFPTPGEKKQKALQEDPGAKWKILFFIGSALYTDLVHEALARILGAKATGGVHRIHGSLSPGQRQKASDAFREKQRSVLVSTDASSRGVDYDGLTLVVQLGYSSRSEFLQRAGRVGRAGAAGEAVALLDPVEGRAVLREGCGATDESCIGDVVLSGAVKVLQAVPEAGPGSRPRSLPRSKQVRFDPSAFGPSDIPNNKAINPRRVYSTWLGGVASNWKRLKLPPAEVLDWARRFAEGLGAPFDPAVAKDKLNMK